MYCLDLQATSYRVRVVYGIDTNKIGLIVLFIGWYQDYVATDIVIYHLTQCYSLQCATV